MKKTISIFFVLIAICFGIMALLFVINPSMGFGYLDRFNNWTGGDPAIPTKNEIVMPPLSTIEAETLNGKIIINQTLPEGFQRAEFLEEKGFVDKVVPRHELKDTLGKLLLFHRRYQ